MTTQQALEQDRILKTVARTLLPFGILFGIVSAGVTLQNQSRELYLQCKQLGNSADWCALQIYGR